MASTYASKCNEIKIDNGNGKNIVIDNKTFTDNKIKKKCCWLLAQLHNLLIIMFKFSLPLINRSESKVQEYT